MDIFSNREIAIGIWLAVVVIFIIPQKKIRPHFWSAIKTLCAWVILGPLILMVLHITASVLLLNTLNLWDMGQLKNTIIWSVTSAFAAFFRISNIAEDDDYFSKAILDIVKVVAVFEFIVTFYSFSLLIEFIFIPAIFIITIMLAVVEGKKGHKSVEKFLTFIQLAIGLALIVYVIKMLIEHFEEFANIGTLNDFTLPIFLSILLLPYLYLISLCINYQNTFICIDGRFRDTPELRRYAKLASVWKFHFRTRLLKRWKRNISLHTPGSNEEIVESINNVFEIAHQEKKPEMISLERGWNPHLAGKFLEPFNIITNDYHQNSHMENAWFSSSPYLEIGDGVLPDNVAYYVDGDDKAAYRLKLVANFNKKSDHKATLDTFVEAVGLLVESALRTQLSDTLVKKIGDQAPFCETYPPTQIQLEHEVFVSNRGYSLKFIICHDLFSEE